MFLPLSYTLLIIMSLYQYTHSFYLLTLLYFIHHSILLNLPLCPQQHSLFSLDLSIKEGKTLVALFFSLSTRWARWCPSIWLTLTAHTPHWLSTAQHMYNQPAKRTSSALPFLHDPNSLLGMPRGLSLQIKWFNLKYSPKHTHSHLECHVLIPILELLTDLSLKDSVVSVVHNHNIIQNLHNCCHQSHYSLYTC